MPGQGKTYRVLWSVISLASLAQLFGDFSVDDQNDKTSGWTAQSTNHSNGSKHVRVYSIRFYTIVPQIPEKNLVPVFRRVETKNYKYRKDIFLCNCVSLFEAKNFLDDFLRKPTSVLRQKSLRPVCSPIFISKNIGTFCPAAHGSDEG